MKIIRKLGRKPIGKQGRTAPFSIYECLDCGSEFEALEWNVNSGRTTRCTLCHRAITSKKIGNFKRTHGETKTRLFSIWSNMIDRCHNNSKQKTDKKYSNYQNKKVTVCDEWKDSFVVFKNWAIDNGYIENLTLDKDILCDKKKILPKIYSPDTCIWITKIENTNYRNNNERR